MNAEGKNKTFTDENVIRGASVSRKSVFATVDDKNSPVQSEHVINTYFKFLSAPLTHSSSL